MEPRFFDEVLTMVGPYISKQNANMRDALPALEKVCATFRFLASGASYKDLMYSFLISSSAISIFVPKVCRAIYKVLEKKYLKIPTSVEEWEKLVEAFESKWQFPHAVGAIDWKHINIRAPPLLWFGIFQLQETV